MTPSVSRWRAASNNTLIPFKREIWPKKPTLRGPSWSYCSSCRRASVCGLTFSITLIRCSGSPQSASRRAKKTLMWTAPSGQPPFLPWRPPDARGEPPEGAWMHSVNGGPRHRELVLPKQHHFGSNISGVWGQSPHASAVVLSSSNIAITLVLPSFLLGRTRSASM